MDDMARQRRMKAALAVRLPAAIVAKLDVFARQCGRSRSDVVRLILRRATATDVPDWLRTAAGDCAAKAGGPECSLTNMNTEISRL